MREKAPIVEYTRYKIDDKRRVLFERAYQKASEALRASSHCLRYELSHCTEDQDYYTLRIEWDPEEGHLKGFRNSSEFKDFFSLAQPYVKDVEEMCHCFSRVVNPSPFRCMRRGLRLSSPCG